MEPILHREARSAGLTRDRLRHARFAHPADGVAIAVEDEANLDVVCQALAKLLPEGSVFTHLTAARLRGWWLPSLPHVPVIACTDGDAPHLDRRGVYIRRCAIPPQHRRTFRGLPVASAAWTIVELAEDLALLDLVVVLDGAVHQGDTTVADVRAAMVKGRRGARVLRQALELVDAKSESPWETCLRLLHHWCDIPVESQVELFDAAGVFVARADLVITGTPRLVEYDGATHRDRERHRRDLRREKELARIGRQRFGYTAVEVVERAAMIVRDAERALGLPHDPARLKNWFIEFGASSFSAEGWRALVWRLRRFDRRASPRSLHP